MLAWGGVLSPNDERSEKESRYIICFDVKRKEINLVQHGDSQRQYHFSTMMCVFANLKHRTGLMAFWNNGQPPLQFFLDSEQDRNVLLSLMDGIVKKDMNKALINAGWKAEFTLDCGKRGGKLKKWSKRDLVVVKSRILIFRSFEKSFYPLQMMSLLEPNMSIDKSKHGDQALEIKCQERVFHYQVGKKKKVSDLLDELRRIKQRLNEEAKAQKKLMMLKQSESKRNMAIKVHFFFLF